MINILELRDPRQTAAAIENLSGSLQTVGDLYITSTFMLPPKLGGVLFGLYDKEDNKKYLEIAAVGKINKSKCFFQIPLQTFPQMSFVFQKVLNSLNKSLFMIPVTGKINSPFSPQYWCDTCALMEKLMLSIYKILSSLRDAPNHLFSEWVDLDRVT